MRATVKFTPQATLIQGVGKIIGLETDCQFAGSSIEPFFTQEEKVDVVIKQNGKAVTNKITIIDIDLSVNQVGICTLTLSDVSGFAVNDVIEVEFTITDYGNVRVFYGYIDRIERNELNQGKIVCADVLRELRDGVLTQIISEFTPETRSNYIGVVFSTQPILPFLLSNYSLNTTIKDTHRELSFGNANKLRILQQFSEEYNLVFWVDYQTNTFIFKTTDTADTFALPLEHTIMITDRAKANTGIKVVYEFHDEKIPDIKATSSIQAFNKDGFSETISKSINISAETKTIIHYTSVSGFFDIGSVSGYGTINQTKEIQKGDDNLRIIRRDIVNYGWATKGILEGFIELSRVTETWDWDSKRHIYRKYEWIETDVGELYSETEIRIEKTGEEEFIDIPTSDINVDEKSIIIGSEENPIFFNTSYISYEDEAKALTDWKVKTELQSKEIDIVIKKIIPGLKPGEYVTSNDFDGSCFTESVRYYYNVQNRNCETTLSGVLLNA